MVEAANVLLFIMAFVFVIATVRIKRGSDG